MAKLKLSAVRRELEVEIETAEGVVEDFILRETDGKGRDAYLNNLGTRMKTTANGKPAGLKNFTGLQSNLLAMCLFKKGEDKPVKEDFIQSLPSSTVKFLYEEAQKLCGIGDGAEEDAKND